jgi:hypothetical protein
MNNIAGRPAFSNMPDDTEYVKRKWIFYGEVCIPDRRLNCADKDVMWVLVESYNFDEGAAFPSRDHIADRTGLHPQTVKESLIKLRRLGLIIRKKGKRRRLYGKTYKATSDFVVWGLDVTGDILTTGSQQTTKNGSQQTTKNGSQLAPPIQKGPSGHPSGRRLTGAGGASRRGPRATARKEEPQPEGADLISFDENDRETTTFVYAVPVKPEGLPDWIQLNAIVGDNCDGKGRVIGFSSKNDAGENILVKWIDHEVFDPGENAWYRPQYLTPFGKKK